MSASELTVGRAVIAQLVRLAAIEVTGVARVGRARPVWASWLAGPAVRVRIRDERVLVRLHVVARPGQALGPLAAEVRSRIEATIERLLGLKLETVTVIVDGVGG